MIAFAGAAAAEAASGKSVVEQAATAPVLVLFAVFLISLASIFPKFASGVPLAKLIDATGMSPVCWRMQCGSQSRNMPRRGRA